jgi:hypothetical protein
MSALEKAKTLQEKAEAKAKAHRRKVWEKIQADYPEHAAFIEQASTVFGRLDGVSIEVNGKEILNSEYRA